MMTDSPYFATIDLSQAVGIGKEKTSVLNLRHFTPDTVSGLLMGPLCAGDVDQMQILIPRISGLIEQEVAQLDGPDLIEVIEAITDYLSPTMMSEGVVELEKPIRLKGGGPEEVVKSLSLRKPGAGELRGLQVRMLKSGSVDQMLALIPRLSMQAIDADSLRQASMTDFANCVAAVINFLLSRSQRASLPTPSKT
jgi:hypothetical protein